ncbi:NAD-dependent epimerase/dehydratase family protein [Gulosibacter sp. 10]|uniref:NAD-dependent epimerase/dehydratase family protein n=1 Tax=Gulosibacter sp. 10 TaxID=1255570 RepID=UPI00097EE593|nr:NAD-dependent epimerase/dehydratase family protein [Gulosibacter sp. 10]SJM54434.1 Nucleoside-diphosphate-sugar epimerases [Gulosibacter sp. 10]
MTRTIVIGAGPIGRASAESLLSRGHEVAVVTRSGTRPPGTDAFVADITLPGTASRLPDAGAILLCANFPYGTWHRDWPPAIATAIAAAERTGAVLVIAGNLYAYGPSAAPFTERDPLAAEYRNGKVRAEVWRRALAAHEAGRIRAVEVRGSDYIGADTGPGAHGGDRLLRPVLAGRPASILGDPDQPHAWTSIDDFGRMLALAAEDERMQGRPWHVPNAPACSMRELARIALRAAGLAREPGFRRLPRPLLRLLATFSPAMAGLRDAAYQFDAPFLVDDSDARTILGLDHTPLATTIAAAVRALRR